MTRATPAPVSWERMIQAVEKVRERLLRAAAALNRAAVPYAIIGGNAVAAWVSRVDESAVRNTQDVDVLIARAHWEAARRALAAAGFVHRRIAMLGQSMGMDVFLDGPDARARDAIHIVFASEKVRAENLLPAPDVAESEAVEHFRLITLEALVRMKLTSYRDKDRTHLRDLIEVGLVDASWLARVPDVLQERLRHILQTPDG